MVTFIITLVVTALITYIITSLYYKHLIKKSPIGQKGTGDANALAEDIKMHDLASNITTRTDIGIPDAYATRRNNIVTVIETANRTNVTVMDGDSAYTLIS